MLPKLKVAAPCPADWNQMSGDHRVRHCSLCNLNVYNLSAMTEPQVLKLLQEREGRLCVRMYQRADGTVITQDCPVGVRAKLKHWKRVAMVALSAALSAPALRGQSNPPNQLVQIRPGQTGVMLTVVDPSGAVVPGADIQITLDGKLAFSGKTSTDGSLISSGLAPGQYEATITSPGFRKHLQQLAVSAGQLSKVSIVLDVAAEMFVGVLVDVDPMIRFDSQQIEANVPIRLIPLHPLPGDTSEKRKNSNR